MPVATCSIAVAMAVARAVTDDGDVAGAADVADAGDAADVGDAAGAPDGAGMLRDTFACAVVRVVMLPCVKASGHQTLRSSDVGERNCREPLRTVCQPPMAPTS